MRYEARQTGERQWRIFHAGQTSLATKGRFHTQAQAEAWIKQDAVPPDLETRVRNILNPPGRMRGRARAYLLTDSNCAGANEARLHLIARGLWATFQVSMREGREALDYLGSH